MRIASERRSRQPDSQRKDDDEADENLACETRHQSSFLEAT